MKNIYLYESNGTKTMEFKFQNPIMEFPEELGWGAIRAAGRTITIYGNPFIVFDEDIRYSTALLDFLSLLKDDMNSAYKEGKKVLVVSLSNGIPILGFYGEKISLNDRGKEKFKFIIDGKEVIIYKMNFLILSKD